jgi:hypothetical protein
MKTKNPNYKEELKIFKQRSKEIAEPYYKKEVCYLSLANQISIEKAEKKVKNNFIIMYVYDENENIINPYHLYRIALAHIRYIHIPIALLLIFGFGCEMTIINSFFKNVEQQLFHWLIFHNILIVSIPLIYLLVDYFVLYKPFFKRRKQ